MTLSLLAERACLPRIIAWTLVAATSSAAGAAAGAAAATEVSSSVSSAGAALGVRGLTGRGEAFSRSSDE